MVTGYTLLALFVFRPVLIDRTHSFLSYYDAAVQTFPWISYNVSALATWQLPLWDFSTYAGTTHFGELQTGVLYPLHLLLLPSNPVTPYALDCYIALHFILGALFMHCLLREIGLRTSASVFGAVLFTLIGNVAIRASSQANLFAGLIWAPLCLLGVFRATSSESRKAGLISAATVGIALGLQILAGHLQAYVHTCVAIIVWVAFLQRRRTSSFLWNLGAVVIAVASSVLLALPQLVGAHEYFRRAYKWYGEGFTKYPHVVPWEEFNKNTIDWTSFRTLYSNPERIYGEWGTLYFSLTGLSIVVAALVMVVGQGRRASCSIPEQHVRVYFGFGLTLALIGIVIALGWHTPLGWLIYKTPGLNINRVPTRALFLETLGASVAAASALELLVQRMSWRTFRWFVSWLSVGLAIWEGTHYVSLLYASVEEPFHPERYYSAERNSVIGRLDKSLDGSNTLYRFLCDPKELVSPNIGLLRPLHSVLGYRSSMSGLLYDYFSSSAGLTDGRWDKLALKTVVTANSREGRSDENVTVYDRPNALPLLWTIDHKGVPKPAPLIGVAWGINDVAFMLDVQNGPHDFFFGQPDYPGWHVSVDGGEKPFVTNDIFLGATVPNGNHVIRFYYAPRWLWPSFLGPVTLLIAILVLNYRSGFASSRTLPKR